MIGMPTQDSIIQEAASSACASRLLTKREARRGAALRYLKDPRRRCADPSRSGPGRAVGTARPVACVFAGGVRAGSDDKRNDNGSGHE
jgi:hypothetical protein